jgi:hypothetical protein
VPMAPQSRGIRTREKIADVEANYLR